MKISIKSKTTFQCLFVGSICFAFLEEVGILLPSSTNKAENYLQFEVHYLDTASKSFITFLCNQSRIILLFDFLLEIVRFILRTEENNFKGNYV